MLKTVLQGLIRKRKLFKQVKQKEIWTKNIILYKNTRPKNCFSVSFSWMCIRYFSATAILPIGVIHMLARATCNKANNVITCLMSSKTSITECDFRSNSLPLCSFQISQAISVKSISKPLLSFCCNFLISSH